MFKKVWENMNMMREISDRKKDSNGISRDEKWNIQNEKQATGWD